MLPLEKTFAFTQGTRFQMVRSPSSPLPKTPLPKTRLLFRDCGANDFRRGLRLVYESLMLAPFKEFFSGGFV